MRGNVFNKKLLSFCFVLGIVVCIERENIIINNVFSFRRGEGFIEFC